MVLRSMARRIPPLSVRCLCLESKIFPFLVSVTVVVQHCDSNQITTGGV